MGYPVAYNTAGAVSGSLDRGNINIFISSSITSTFQGATFGPALDVPTNGMLIIGDNGSTPLFWAINDLTDADLVLNTINRLPDRVNQTPFTDTGSALAYITGSSDYTPLNGSNSEIPEYLFGANLYAHHDASLPTSSVDIPNFNTVDTTGTTSISRLYDVSGNGRHAYQTTKANQPTIGTLNGKNTALAASSGKGLQINGLASNPSTYYIVYKWTGGDGVFQCGRGGVSDGFLLTNTNLQGYSGQFSPPNVFCGFGSPSANNQYQILVLNCFSTYTDFYLTTNNGTIQNSLTVLKNTYGGLNADYIINANYQTGYFCRNLGSRIDSFGTGEIAEAFYVNRTSTTSEITTMQNYLYSKWFN